MIISRLAEWHKGNSQVRGDTHFASHFGLCAGENDEAPAVSSDAHESSGESGGLKIRSTSVRRRQRSQCS